LAHKNKTFLQVLATNDHPQDFISRGWDYVLLGESYMLKLPWLDTVADADLLNLSRSQLYGKIFNYQPNFDKSNLTVSTQGLWFLEKQGFGIT
jgi:hypothetical protein